MAYLRRHLIPILAAFALLVVWTTRAAAQNGAGSEGGRSFQAIALAQSPVLAELFYLRGPDNGVPLELSPHRLSPSPISAGAGPLVLAVRRADAQGKQSFVPVAQVEWPQGGKADRALLIVAVSGSGRDTKVQAIAVDHSVAAFPKRTMRVVNLSGRPLLGQFGEFRGEVPPGPGRPVAYPAVKTPANGGVGRFQVAIGQRAAQGDSMKILFNGWTEAWPEARTLVLVAPGANPDRPLVRFVVDSLREDREKPRQANNNANGR